MKNAIRRLTQYYDNPFTGDTVYTINIVIDPNSIRAGFIKSVGGPTALSILLTIISFTNADGVAFPSQHTIADATGLSVRTVNTVIKELLEVEIDGQKILSREFAPRRQDGGFQSSIYTFYSSGATEVKAEPVETVETPTMPPKEVITYFCERYEETFGEKYLVSWGREAKLVKEKLSSVLTREEIRGMIDIAVGEYTTRWANGKYLRPSISMLCGWLGNTALALVKEAVVEAKKFEEAKEWDFGKQEEMANRYL